MFQLFFFFYKRILGKLLKVELNNVKFKCSVQKLLQLFFLGLILDNFWREQKRKERGKFNQFFTICIYQCYEKALIIALDGIKFNPKFSHIFRLQSHQSLHMFFNKYCRIKSLYYTISSPVICLVILHLEIVKNKKAFNINW